MSKIGGACYSPRITPRPDYGPAGPVLMKGVLQLVRFPLLCTLMAKLVLPFYEPCYQGVIYHTQPLWETMEPSLQLYTPWVNQDDLWFAIGLTASIQCCYSIVNIFFASITHFKLLQAFKLPRTPSQEPSPQLVRGTLLKQAVAHTFTGPALMLFIVGPLIRHTSPISTVDVANIPNFFELWKQFGISYVVNEVMFYWGHRLLHHKLLYGIIHKQHHSYIGTISIATEYAHFVEDVLTAYIPFLMGIFINKSHFFVVFMWFGVRLVEAYETHSGYCFKGTLAERVGISNAEGSAFHDFHHTCNQGNFGSEMMDYFFGTMDAYVATGSCDGYIKKGKEKNKKS